MELHPFRRRIDQMINVGVDGIAGRMGQRLAHLILESNDLTLASARERPEHACLGRDVGSVIGTTEIGVSVIAKAKDFVDPVDVVVAFTAPEATVEIAKVCGRSSTALVAGTTGLSEAQSLQLKDNVSEIPCVFAPNFSTAMNVLFKLVEQAANILGDEYDIEVVEAHHRYKADAPSGTALRLGESAAKGLDRKLSEVAVHGREGAVGERSQKEIGMHAVRMGDLAGDHSVYFGAPGEYLELKHHATSRDAFALGALRAVRFAASAPNGIYDMGDVLGLT